MRPSGLMSTNSMNTCSSYKVAITLNIDERRIPVTAGEEYVFREGLLMQAKSWLVQGQSHGLVDIGADRELRHPED